MLPNSQNPVRTLRGCRPAAVLIVASLCMIGGCSPASQPPDRPLIPPTIGEAASQPAATATRPSETQSPATKPAASKPASKPAGPVSTFSSKPPYPVDLHVQSPLDPQPGWLKILGLDNKGSVAAAHGVFPEQNVMVIDTENVKRLEIHVGYLPMAQRKRIVLRIDKQAIELSRSQRYVTFERRPTGEWVVEKPKK